MGDSGQVRGASEAATEHFIIYKGVVAYAISQLRFDMITLKLESHAVSHAMSSAFVLVKKRNLESLTNKVQVECTSAAMDFH